jgi:filamentous hemagglutinin
MNKNLFRIIFNKRRGLLMAVAETSSSQGKGSRGEAITSAHPAIAGNATVALSALSFAVLCTLGVVLWALPTPNAHAQVVAYRNAPGNQQPTILQTANGVPQVDIQTPSAAGVSRNIYSQFDVQSNGVILNNSRTSVQTQQGGWVQGNPWLATGSARVILNEVNSSNPSYLNGYVEVAGQRAEVVIANPSGISVNGGGFINTSKATLTTGTPIINGGSLDGYRMQDGNISINGNGLDLSTTDYAAILARAVQVNAGIWANELKVVTGANQIDASSLATNTTPVTTAIAGTGAVPSFALDVAQIGGMYAGKIHLIGTEQGLGVRSAGTIGSTGGDLVLQNNGWLTTTGTLQASANLQITTLGNISNSGTLYASNDQTLSATGSVTNSGVIAAQGNTTITANNLSSSAASVVGAGIKTDGSLINNTSSTSGNLSVTTTQDLAANGQNLAAGNISLTGASVDLSGSKTSATDVAITTAGNFSSAQATVVASQNLNVASADLNNAGGTLAAGQAANLQTAALNNDGGLIQTGADLTINTHGQTLTNTNAANYTNSNAALNGKGGIATQGTTTLTTGDLNNDAGYIGSKGALSVTSANINNTLVGQIQGLDNVTLAVGAGGINNAGGLIRSATTTRLSAGTVTNSNTLSTTNPDLGIEGRSVTLSAAALGNNNGAIRAVNNLSVTSAGTVNNNAGLMSAGDTLSVQDSQAASSRTLTISNTAGTLIADKTLTVAAGSLGGDGKVLSLDSVSLNLNTNFSNSGQVVANGNATVSTSGDVSNSGKLQAGGTLNLTANNIDNAAAGEVSGNTTQVNANSTLTNRGLIDGVDTQINAATVNNIGTGRIYGDHLSMAAVNLTNDTETLAGVTKAGTIAARDRLDLGISGTLTNREHALIYSVGDMAIGGALDATRQAIGSANTVNNNSATIEAGGNLSLATATLNNTNDHFAFEERITSQQNNVREDITPTYYRIFTRTIYDPYITSTDPAKIFSVGNMTLNAGSMTNQLSQVVAGAVLSVQGGSLQNTSVESLHRIVDIGTNHNYQVVGQSCGWYRGRRVCDDVYDWALSAYQPPSVNTTVTVSQATSVYNTPPAGTNNQVAALNAVSLSANTNITSSSLVRTSNLSSSGYVSLPGTSLYKTNPGATARYLIETDALFTNQKRWLGSDFMTQSLSLDPTVTQKRLGDGFYEQKLIREQVAELTGRRFLADYTSDEQEYKALMTNAITFGQTYDLRPGIALTAQQIAQLTSDIVWLVEQTVTLPDGSSQKVLVPQVYVKVQPGDLDGSGTLLAGKDVNINLSGDLTNSGTIAGRNVVRLTAENVNNLGGRIGGNDVSVAAQKDLNNIGGSISAVNSLSATTGRDLINQTTLRSASSNVGANSFSRTTLDRVAGLYVSGPDGTLVASAGRDMNIVAGVVNNAGNGVTHLNAGNNFKLSNVTTSSSDLDVWDSENYRKSSTTTDVGSTVQGGGKVTLTAGQTLSATAANVQAAGGLAVQAQDVRIEAGKSTTDFDEAHKVSGGGGFFGGATLVTRETSNTSTAVASNFGGATVDISASSKDINIMGSNVVSDNATTLVAVNNVNIEAAQNTSQQSSFRQKTETGFLSGGGIGISYGTRMQSNDGKDQTNTAAVSTVGSVNGNVAITASNQYKQVGSDVLTPNGNIDITAKTVTIQEARETNKQSTEQKFEQSGLTLALTGGVIDSIQATTQAVQAAKDSSSNRNRNLNALIAYGKGSDAYEQGQAMQSAYDKNGVMGDTTGADGKPSPDAAGASGIKVSVSIGSSSSQSNSTTASNTSAASTVKAGGSVSIKATGQGDGEGNLTVQGSNVSAVKDVSLNASQDVNILASADTESNRSTNSSSSTSVGVSVGIGSGGAGLSLDIAASRGKGQANSDSTTYNNSQITAGQKMNITSDADTNLKGGTVSGQQVTANVGGNLNVESLQDKAISAANQSTTGIAVSIPIVGTGGSASFSQNKQNSNSNYASVNEQSGIKAGDGGFQVNVQGNTDLKGATLMGSSDARKNTLTTNTLSISDINNSMSASASSSGVSVGTNMMDGKYAMGKAIAGNLLNNGSASQSDASTTTSAISAAQVTVNGNTTDTGKEQLKDSNGKAVRTDTSNTNRTLAKADVAGLQKSAQDQQASNMLVLNAAVALTDPAFKAAFLDQATMYKKVVDTKGNVSWQEMTPEEKAKISPRSRIANNGIFNGGPNAPEPAQNLAEKNSSGDVDYLVHFPQANNKVSELLVAGYQKFLENSTTGLTNATQQNVDLWEQTGGNITLDGHSRGGMTVGNALTAVQEQGGKGGATNVNLFGSAYNVQDAANTVNQITNGAGQVISQVHKDDFVGTVLGGNAATGGTTPSGSSTLQEWIKILGGDSTSHNNYGDGRAVPDGQGGTKSDIDKYWDGAKPVSQTVKPTNQLISLPAGESK